MLLSYWRLSPALAGVKMLVEVAKVEKRSGSVVRGREEE